MSLDSDFVKNNSDSPFRSPDWRWRRATASAADLRRVSRTREDPATRRAATFLRALTKAASEKARRRIVIAFPDLLTASELAQNGGRRQLEIESRVLARQPAELIAEPMALPLHTVRAYQTMFFDVADRIDVTGYITHVVLGLNDATATTETWIRACAYHHGPHVIEQFLDYLEHAVEVHNLATAEGRQRESIALFLAVRALDVEAKDLAALRKLAPIIFSQTRDAGGYVPIPAVFAGQMQRSLSRLPFRAPDESSSLEEIPMARRKAAC